MVNSIPVKVISALSSQLADSYPSYLGIERLEMEDLDPMPRH